MTENEEKGLKMSLTEAANRYHVTRQAIFLAIKKRNLKAHQEGRQWYIYERDIDEYRASKYNREKSKFNGQYLYSREKHEMSPRQCAKLFGVEEQHIYYLVHVGKLEAEKRGYAIVIKYEDAMKRLGEDPRQEKFA